jgi:glycerol-3-phosphate acyltransferase PlsX
MMGSDLGPAEFVRGIDYALNKLELDSHFILVGNGRLIERLIKAAKLDAFAPKLSIHHASEVIAMEEKPIQALKSKKDSSMAQALKLLKQQQAQALVSCGNTGALMAGGTLRLRPLKGVERPALATIIPTKKTPFVLVDVGANPECTPENLVHNAVLGSNYAKAALKIERPRVALLTIGTEEGKGNNLVNQTHPLLQKIEGIIHYVGPVEGFQLFEGAVDVVVCDGFVGNIVLKTSEALFKFVGGTIKEELLRNPKRKIGAALSAAAYRDMKARLSPDNYSGAPLLGLAGNILKSHGASNSVAIGNALRISQEIVAHDMLESIASDIQAANKILEEANHLSSTAC